MHLKPSPDLTVPDPERGGALPTEGREVAPSTYWQRRLADGDVVEALPPEPVHTSAQPTDASDTP